MKAQWLERFGFHFFYSRPWRATTDRALEARDGFHIAFCQRFNATVGQIPHMTANTL